MADEKKEEITPKPKMSDEERQELIKKLDEDLDQFIKEKTSKKKKRAEEDIDVDTLAEELLQHPLFIKELDYSKPLPPLMQGLQAMMYESEDLDENAESFKEDGNRNFKLKKYRWAIDNYTEGIKCRCKNLQLNAILYSNRAASHFHIGNFRSAYRDCIFARKFKPDHFKAIFKGAQCFMELKHFDDAMKWCDTALLINPSDPKTLEMRSQAVKLKKAQERDSRKQKAQERKEEEAERKLVKAVRARGVKLMNVSTCGDPETDDLKVLSALETHHPSGAKVFMGETGVLHWPVLFLYPEHAETDFIDGFHEESRFEEHLHIIFGPSADIAPWDKDKKYKPNRIQVYFENRHTETLHEIRKDSTLLEALRHERYFVQGGMPTFILLVSGSPYQMQFVQKYKK